jgi:hypothetical protein
MRLVITAGPPDIWVGLEPETAEEATALEAWGGFPPPQKGVRTP